MRSNKNGPGGTRTAAIHIAGKHSTCRAAGHSVNSLRSPLFTLMTGNALQKYQNIASRKIAKCALSFRWTLTEYVISGRCRRRDRCWRTWFGRRRSSSSSTRSDSRAEVDLWWNPAPLEEELLLPCCLRMPLYFCWRFSCRRFFSFQLFVAKCHQWHCWDLVLFECIYLD